MSIVAVIPALIAAYIAWTQSPNRAFIYVYVPVLLFLPDYYYWKVPGLPDPNFGTAAILVITAIWLIRGSPGWRFSGTDILVFGYAFSVLYSEYLSPEGQPHYQNFIANFTGSVICPYILAKSLIEPAGLREDFAKSIAFTLFLVAGVLALQFVTRSHYTLTQFVLGRFFGGQGWRLTADMRWGLIRANGPFQHEILAGIIMWTGYRIQRWLQWSQAWPTRLRQLPWLPIPTAQLLSLGIFAGALMTLTRGPMLGALVAAFIPLMGLSKRRWTIFWILVAFGIIVGIPVISWFIGYASVDPATIESKGHQTVAYRWQLVINYFDIAMEQAVLGWGRFGWPNIGQSKWSASIDNHLLLLFLKHGLMGLGFFVAIFLSMMVRLFIHSMRQPIPELRGSSLGFTLLSLYILIFISIATVWLGHQTQPLLFLIIGWSEGYLRSGRESLGNRPTTSPISRQPFKFRRVL
jgi:hypothetical protein